MIKIGVLGAGHLGSIHLKCLKDVPAFEVVGFFDTDPEKVKKAQAAYGYTPFESAEALIDAVDAIDIVTPTMAHFQPAQLAIRKGKHVFIEKPVTSTLEEATKLVKLVEEAQVKAQVGHVERFNPAFLALRDHPVQPLFIQCDRLAQWNPRGTDVSVVLDLMIHDIDIIQHLVKSRVKKVSANGVAIVSDTPDIANARVEFHNGCVANITASRMSVKNMRRLRLFQPGEYVTIDFLEKKTEIFTLHDDAESAAATGMPMLELPLNESEKRVIAMQRPDVQPVNAIQMELTEFAEAIKNNTEPPVSIFDAKEALETAMEVLEKIGG